MPGLVPLHVRQGRDAKDTPSLKPHTNCEANVSAVVASTAPYTILFFPPMFNTIP